MDDTSKRTVSKARFFGTVIFVIFGENVSPHMADIFGLDKEISDYSSWNSKYKLISGMSRK